MPDSMHGRRILLTTDAVGGVWTYSLDMAREFSSRGVECVMAVVGPSPTAAMTATARSLTGVSVVDTRLPLDWTVQRPEEVITTGHRLAEIARTHRCDTVHLHTPAFAAAKSFEQPVVSVHHSCPATWWQAVRPGENMPDDVRWRSFLVANGIAASNALVVPTTAHGHAVADVYGLSRPAMTIRNGRHAASPPQAIDVTARTSFAFTSGRLWDEGKNVASLERAAALTNVPIVAAGPITGPGGIKRTFPNLRLTGHLGEDELRRWLSAAPLYVSVARYEPFGLGVLEAAQAGCALVLSDIPSFREVWSGACLFVDSDDDRALARAISETLEDKPLLRRLSSRATSRARHYTAQAMARETLRLHAGLITLHAVENGAAA